MTRTRQIAAVDSNMRERVMHRPQGGANPYGSNLQRPSNSSLLYRLRSGEASQVIMSGCGSMRDFCTNVQNITNDISNLLTSIENILPIVSTYLSLAPAKETIPVIPEAPRLDAPAHPPAANTVKTSPSPDERSPEAAADAMPAPAPAPKTAPSCGTPPAPAMNGMPRLRPEDIQQFLSNPLVKNLLTTLINPNQK